jgi:hypothetical protein
MPGVDQTLLTEYLLQQIGLTALITFDTSEDQSGYLMLSFNNNEKTEYVYKVTQQLLQPQIDKAGTHTQYVTKSDYTIGVPMPHLRMQFLADLKAIAISIITKPNASYFDPHDFAEDDYRFCEQIGNSFSLPSIHINIVEEIKKKFLLVGIKLQHPMHKNAWAFTKHKNYITNEILLSTATFEMRKLVAAREVLVSKSPTSASSFHPGTIFNTRGKPPRASKTSKSERVTAAPPSWK